MSKVRTVWKKIRTAWCKNACCWFSASSSNWRAILTVVEPAAIEVAVWATEQEKVQQDEILSALQRELQTAQYAARRAQKQYDTTDPNHRLVAGKLERR
jgi:hypothetical protein